MADLQHRRGELMTEIHSRRAAEEGLIEKASRDESFKRQLIENPRRVIEIELSIRMPADVTVKVLEETPRTLYLVLPARVKTDQELTEQELESVAGGRGRTKELQEEMEEIQEEMSSPWEKV
jgi:hypothetical protein